MRIPAAAATAAGAAMEPAAPAVAALAPPLLVDITGTEATAAGHAVFNLLCFSAGGEC